MASLLLTLVMIGLLQHFFNFLCSLNCARHFITDLLRYFVFPLFFETVRNNHDFIKPLKNIDQSLPHGFIFEQFLSYCQWYLKLQTGNAQQNSLLIHGVHAFAPVSIQIRVHVKFAGKTIKYYTRKYVSLLFEEIFHFINQQISHPVNFHRSQTDVYLAFILFVKLSMNINM